MSQSKRKGRVKGMTRLAARRAETELPDWLYHTLTPHEPTYNPTLEPGTLRQALISVTAQYPKVCCLLLLAAVLLAWAGFLALSTLQANNTLIGLAWLELPFLIGCTLALWPMLLYRLTGLPKPAPRPSNRSKKQMTARLFYRGSFLTWFFVVSVAAIVWLWLIIYLFSQSKGDDAWLGAGLGLIFLPVPVAIIIKVVKEFPGVRIDHPLPSQRVRIPQVKLKRIRSPAQVQRIESEQANEG